MVDNKPSQIGSMETLYLISGIWNCLHTLTATIIFISFGISTCGFGCVLLILPIVNIVAAIMDFIAYNKLKNLNVTGTYSSAQFAAILDIVTILTLSIVSVILGIVNLANNLSNDEVKNYLKEKGVY